MNFAFYHNFLLNRSNADELIKMNNHPIHTNTKLEEEEEVFPENNSENEYAIKEKNSSEDLDTAFLHFDSSNFQRPHEFLSDLPKIDSARISGTYPKNQYRRRIIPKKQNKNIFQNLINEIESLRRCNEVLRNKIKDINELESDSNEVNTNISDSDSKIAESEMKEKLIGLQNEYQNIISYKESIISFYNSNYLDLLRQENARQKEFVSKLIQSSNDRQKEINDTFQKIENLKRINDLEEKVRKAVIEHRSLKLQFREIEGSSYDISKLEEKLEKANKKYMMKSNDLMLLAEAQQAEILDLIQKSNENQRFSKLNHHQKECNKLKIELLFSCDIPEIHKSFQQDECYKNTQNKSNDIHIDSIIERNADEKDCCPSMMEIETEQKGEIEDMMEMRHEYDKVPSTQNYEILEHNEKTIISREINIEAETDQYIDINRFIKHEKIEVGYCSDTFKIEEKETGKYFAAKIHLKPMTVF